MRIRVRIRTLTRTAHLAGFAIIAGLGKLRLRRANILHFVPCRSII